MIIGNPPYNAHQLDENDNNKNRRYKIMDRRVRDTFSKSGTASNKSALSDPYVKAIRWASDKILENREGVVAFVSNNSFVGDFAFDGMRKHLAADFDLLYILDLGGNVRKNPKISGTTHNVFGIQVGVSINVLVRLRDHAEGGKIFYSRADDFWRKEDKFSFLESCGACSGVKWQEISPDAKHTWLTEGLKSDFDDLLSMGTRETKAGIGNAIFRTFSSGIKTNRDFWVYNFEYEQLAKNIRRTIETYNEHVSRWSRLPEKSNLDDFVSHDDLKISWSRDLKADLKRGRFAEYSKCKIRQAIYRPFTKMYLFLDSVMNQDIFRWPAILPSAAAEKENRIICVKGSGGGKPFMALMIDSLTDVSMVGFGTNAQCFSFYMYDNDGTNRRENITDWAVERFSWALGTDVDKWQIFHYVYGLLHASEYRQKYQANLKRELPRIPLPKSVEDFRGFVSAGERLAELHVNYESQQEYHLEKIENPDKPLNWRVEKMKITKDKTAIIYNDFLTLAGIPPEAFEYKLGNRSALEWIIDRYQVHRDKRSGIVNDPNRADNPEYIVKLIGKVVTVSLETVKTVADLPKI